MKKIDLVIDGSGSMAEEGKSCAVKYTVTALRHLMSELMPAVDCRVYSWAQAVEEVSGPAQLRFLGRSPEKTMEDFLIASPEDPVLLLTDGTVELLPRPNLFVLVVGEEADLPALERRFGRTCVYRAEDAALCLQELRGWEP